ncbi:FxDxF family PEP-CTERM protein [Aquabacterium sp.]|uniref:FxDxF family PEP-CTERM protein n=1 Tax=Aquabacterium sp. TaxID=1872578 RepID=UPI0025C550B5|nr:FxDxF family PEP-CTERM protein [Aquabacterium sp.]
MFQSRQIVLLVAGLVSAMSVWADPANHVVNNFGDITLPFTRSIGNTFAANGSGGYVSQDGSSVVLASIGGKSYFYDDYVFNLPFAPQASFNAAAVSIDLGSFLSLQDFSARLYKLDADVASLTTGLPSSGKPIQSWTSSALLAPGLTGTTVLFQNVDLQAGARYALEFRGTIAGAFGGSYGGNLNITPVPEPSTAAIVLAALGVIGLLKRRRQP